MPCVCRTCLQKMTNLNFVHLNNSSIASLTVKNKLVDCIPEILIDLVKDPVMCISCLTSLDMAFNFKRRCLQSEARLRTYVQSNKVEKNGLDLVKIVEVLSDVPHPNIMNNVRCRSTNMENFETTTTVNNASANNDLKIQDDIDVEKHEIEDADYKVPNLYFNSVIMEKFCTEKQLQTESSEPKMFEGCVVVKEDKLDDAASEDFEVFTARDNSENKEENDFQDDVDVEKHKMEDFEFKPFDLQRNSVSVEEPCFGQNNNQSIGINKHLVGSSVKQSLVVHVNSRPRKKLFACEVCNYRFSRKGILQNHMKTHTGERPFKCNVCTYTCSQNGSLHHHMKIHSGEKPFKCEICSYRFSRKGNLQNHMNTHTGEKPFKCEVCSYRCSQSGSLYHHMKTHSGEKLFTCEVCNYRFSRKGVLQNHMKTHTGEKPFKCKVCDYRCSQNGSLYHHMKIHSGDKPFKCEVCSFRFSRKGSLQNHMKTHTGEKQSPCKV